MKKLHLIFLLPLWMLFFGACTYEFPEPNPATIPSAGSADFSKFVVVGNSITAGFMDGALYSRGQKASYGNILAAQLKSIGGGDFRQPDIESANGFFGFAPDGVTPLGRLAIASGATAPSPKVPGDPIRPFSGDKSKLNNFGVPGLGIAASLLPGYGKLNPYFGRFAANASTSSVIGDAMAANPSFFIFWLGNNDVLGYAMQGASGKDGGLSPTDLTSVLTFTAAYNAALSQLTGKGAKGVVANIPDVTNIPFFTTIAYNQFPLDAATAALLNKGYTAKAHHKIAPQVITVAIQRTQVIPAVATEAVRQQTLAKLMAAGVPQSQAEAQAAAFLASAEGKSAILKLTNAMIEKPADYPKLQAAVAAQMKSAKVQAGIKAFSESYLAAFAANPTAPKSSPPFTQAHFDLVYGATNAQISQLKTAGFLPVVKAGNNPFIIDDPKSPTGIRFLKKHELITLRAAAVPKAQIQSWLAQGKGFPDEYILTEDEIQQIHKRTRTFNDIIAKAVSNHSGKVALLDINAVFKKFAEEKTPSSLNGIAANSTLVPPFGLFSFDGIHPNGRGQAWIANNFIKTINKTFGANVLPVNENNYPANDLPQ